MNGEQNGEHGGRGGLQWFQILYIVALVAVLAGSVYFLIPHRVGVLDVTRVARETGVAARIEREFRARQQQAVERATKLQKEKAPRINELARKTNASSGAEKALLQDELDKAREELEYSITEMKRDLQNHQSKLWLTFRKRLQPYIEAVARQRKMDVILDPSASVVYVRSKVDVTAEVIDKCRDYFTAALPLLDEKAPALIAPVSDEGEAPLAPAEPLPPQKEKAQAPAKSKTSKK